jgi:predicted nuclease of predicted toxin-antitoxin system
MKLLLDENLSPRLVRRLAAKGVFASHVAHIGRAGLSDPELWRYAYDSGRIVATLNVRDFLLLAGAAEIHAGLIVLRASSLSP